METFFGGMLLFILLIAGAGIVSFIFWLWMFISAIKGDFENKGVWIIVLLIGNIIGAIAFYFAVHRKIKAAKQAPATPTP
ncbi:MAG: PLDc N-terminal domain-containing protein [bacterium]